MSIKLRKKNLSYSPLLYTDRIYTRADIESAPTQCQ